MKKLLFCLVALGLGFTQLSAQDKKGYGHLTFSVDLGLGPSLLNQPKELTLPNEAKGGGNFGVSLLYHLPSIRSQVGLGFSSIGHGYPDGYRVGGVHLDYKYHVSKKLQPLVLHTRLGYSFNSTSDIGSFPLTEVKYTSDKFYGSVAVGWEFSRLLGPIGFAPAVGISYSSFDYNMRGLLKSGSSNQAMLFFRLALLIN